MKKILFLVIAIIFLVFIFIDTIEQPQNYYNFSEKKKYFSVNNFWNVISNIPFIIIGVIEIYDNKNKKFVHSNFKTTPIYSLFFLSIF